MGVYGNIWVPDNNDLISSLTTDLATMAASIDALTTAIQADILDRSPKVLYTGYEGTGTATSGTPAIIHSTGSLNLGSSPRQILITCTGLFSGTPAGASGLRAWVTGTPIPGNLYLAQGAPGTSDGQRVTGNASLVFTHSGIVNYSYTFARATGTGTLSALQGTLAVIDLGPA